MHQLLATYKQTHEEAWRNHKKWHVTHQRAVKEIKELKRENQQKEKLKQHIGALPVANCIRCEKPNYAY